MPKQDSPYHYTFTVFTATFNRAHTLHRVFDSLVKQTFHDFEWLVIDDGSTDNTAELIQGWEKEVSFPIRYIKQDNMGKHIAFNRGVEQADGEFLLVLDSDDACAPNALQQFKYHWDNIDSNIRSEFSGVTSLCEDQNGRLVGDLFPEDILDSDALELRYKYRVKGEKWGFQCTDVLREYPFPHEVNQSHLPESIVWNNIARKYKTRFVNESLRTYWIDGPSLIHSQNPSKNAVGGRLQHIDALNNDIFWFRYARKQFLLSAMHYSRFSFHTGEGLQAQFNALNNTFAKIIWGIMLPLGYVVYLKDSK